MIRRTHVQGKANRDSSLISRQGQLAPRPFCAPEPSRDKSAARAPERVPCCMSFEDIDILPRTVVQPKLALGPARDRYEKEADLVARQVVTAISSERPLAPISARSNRVQRISEPASHLSSTQGPHVAPETEASIRQARSGGQPLSDDVRAPMEQAFGADFSGVRVHADGRADGLNRSLQARAFTAGQDIFLRRGEHQPGSSEGQRLLANELTRMVQQGQGREKRTIKMKDDVPAKDEVGLEQYTDVMARRSKTTKQIKNIEKQTYSHWEHYASKLDKKVLQPQVIQRYVSEFDAELEIYDPPGTDLIETIDMTKYSDDPKLIKNNIRQVLNDPLVKSLEVPKKVSATLISDKDDEPPERNLNRSRNIGLIGRDEFFIKTGVSENFEGGHLIPHAMWDFNDRDVGIADSYRNLVPMSRTLNVMDWADREDRFKKKLEEIPQGDQLLVSIDITHENYNQTYGWLAQLFQLHLKDINDENKNARAFYGWIPVRSEPSWLHIETGSDEDMSDVGENRLRDTHTKIKTPAELILELKGTPFWNRMSKSLKSRLKYL